MDYIHEYLEKNPDMHLGDTDQKLSAMLGILPSNQKFKRIIDIACGAGAITTELKKVLKPDYMEGIDISPGMIDAAVKLDTKKAVEWKVKDFYKYEIKDKFDLAICNDILEHVEDEEGFLNKLAGDAKHVAIKVPLEDSLFSRFLIKSKIFDVWKDTEERYGHIHHYSKKSLDTLIESNGFEIVKADYIPMPKRSKFRWEFFRLLFYPLSLISMDLMIKVSGGFRIYFLKSTKI